MLDTLRILNVSILTCGIWKQMLDPVLAIRHIHAHLRERKHQSRNLNVASDGCTEQFPFKKRKMSSPNASHISCGSSREVSLL